MSLKVVHVVFIAAAAIMCLGIGYFRGMVCLQTAELAACGQAGASIVGGLGLIYYGVRFLQKYKWLGYL